MAKSPQFVRVALVLPTEFAYARGVLRGIIAATRERNMYAREQPGRRAPGSLPWLFRVYRGIYGHSSKYLARWFNDWRPDGIIGQIYDDRLSRVYRDTGKPVVELFESRTASEFPRILPDDVATGELAARHFLERGFRHFGFFGAPWMLWSHERAAGFEREIRRAFQSRAETEGAGDSAREFTISNYVASDTTAATALKGPERKRSAAMAAWLASLPRPVAVFAANDLWGFELVQAVRELGLHVPDDVAILGVDNEELLCEIAHPPLSSIPMGAEQIGRAAVNLMEQLLRGGSARLAPERVPPREVVTRQSTDVLAVEDPDVAAALRHIRQHAAEGLSVKELLGELAVNRRTLERRFISALGHTLLEEIRRVRLERAKALLQTDMPIYDVATHSGFATPEYLATSFIRAVGMTPSAFRRQRSPGARWPHLPG